MKLRYKAPTADKSQLLSQPVSYAETEWEQVSEDFRLAAAVAEFGMLLRDSPHKANATYERVLELAEGAGAAQSDDPRFEFLYLVRAARQLSEHQTVSRVMTP